ncbi:MAG: glycine C-acetyltransferase [Candidatus Undinarchaeales archaeon]|nr:glycine C-acetyltransferase [Candidatus Undinarchaeales archaeon]MDP7492190.1 glycine C-acetyltransferase [Candidatus Undinarchaeales archaeon]
MRDSKAFLKQEYERLVNENLDWHLKVLEGPSTPRCTIDGRDVIMLCSNNYLNLSNHPKIKQAAIDAIKSHGAGSGSVRAIAGNMDIHEVLEAHLARLKDVEAALVYQTGFAANAGLVPQLVGAGDIIISDELNHGSIIDGVRLSKADKGVYAHNDMADLERVLNDADKDFKRILIITDGVFSMDGDIAPLDKIVKLAEEFGAMTYVDDAHGEGVIGDGGRGIVSHFGLEGRVDVEMGTFSKAFGVVGGYVSGTQDLKNFALNKSRTWLLSGSHPPAVAAACNAAISVLEDEPQHHKTLWENIRYFKAQLESMGFDCGHSDTAITPVIVGESKNAKALSDAIIADGVFALPILFPMVAKDKARIRTMMNAGHTREDLDTALEVLERNGKKLGLI